MANKEFNYTPITAIRSIDDAEAFQNSVRDFARTHWAEWKAEMLSRPCPFCGLDDPQASPPFAESFEVSRCGACDSLYVNPVPTASQLASFYSTSEPIRILNDIYARRSAKSAGFVSDTRMDKVISCLGQAAVSRKHGLSILEVGCNNGRFIASLDELARNKGVALDSLVGIDVDETVLPETMPGRCEYKSMDMKEAASRSEFRERFDVICHFELIEHLPDPAAFIRDASQVLKPGGFMVFTTPNAAGLEIEAAGYNDYRLMSHAIFPPMHLNAFSVYNTTMFAVRNGYRMISMETPGRLDVDCVTRYAKRNDQMEPEFEVLPYSDDDTLAMIQALVARLRASSTLLVVLQRPAGGRS